MKKPILYVVVTGFFSLFLLIGFMGALEVGLRLKNSWADRSIASPPPGTFTESEAFDAPIFVPSPFTIVYNKPNMQLANLSTNSLGFRGSKELPAKKETGVKRVFVIGGSAAVGMKASNDSKTIPAQLEAFLQKRYPSMKIEVYNAAAAGFNSIQDLIYLAKNLVYYEPDLIVNFGGGTDINTSMEANWHPNYHELGESYLSQSTHPWHEHSFAMRALMSLKPAKKAPPKVGVLHPQVADVYSTNVMQMASICHAIKIPFIAMLQPALVMSTKAVTEGEWKRHQTALSRGGLATNYESLAKQLYPIVRSTMKSKTLPPRTYFIDGSDLFAGQRFEAFSDSFHLTDDGYHFAAEKIGAFIVEKHLL